MQSFRITDVKGFMAQLLTKEMFDHFLLVEATIHNRISYVIDGHKRGEEQACIPYGEVRPLCFDMIKGKQTPEFFQFVLQLPPNLKDNLIEDSDVVLQSADVLSLSMNIRFQNNELTLMTGTSLRIFTVDRSLEKQWDQWVRHFLVTNHCTFEENV
ncbi:MAG: DUF5721 family protein [Lachnospiraceae bacterium]|nr:DUF5721 family protein [Lachnospiraceae bacterium]